MRNHILAAILAATIATPALASAQPPTLDPARTVIITVEVLADGAPVSTLPADMRVTYSASSSAGLAMRWCAPGLPSPAACSIVNANSAFLVTPERQAYGRILPTAADSGNSVFVNLRRGSSTIASLTLPIEIAQATPPTPTTVPATPTPREPEYSIRAIITQ